MWDQEITNQVKKPLFFKIAWANAIYSTSDDDIDTTTCLLGFQLTSDFSKKESYACC